jgi:mono/diheme cytochrome c family protein
MRHTVVVIALLLFLAACSGRSDKTESRSVSTSTSTSEGKKELPAKVQAGDISEHPGKQLYNQHCLPCHQADGNGVPGMFPPLTDPEWIDGDNERLISIVIHGLDEEIVVKGEHYNTIMAPLPHLSDREVMDVLNYVRSKFGTSGNDITIEEVRKVRDSGT